MAGILCLAKLNECLDSTLATNKINRTGHPVTRFTTTWTVPAAPSTHSDQTVFLFNGIQNSTMIYQPVLQWGPSGAGGGNFWAVTWKIVYQRFNRWAKSGVFERIFKLLASDHDKEYMMIDATIVRAHQHSAGAQKKTASKRSVDPAAD
jgi:hypothetical protein